MFEGNKGSSINFESTGRGKNLSHPPPSDYNLARLNYINSQEPGETAEANALRFVDRFLSSNNVGMSPSVGHGKTFREKSLPVFSAKGTQVWQRELNLEPQL